MKPIDRLLLTGERFLIAGERFLNSKTAENWIWIFAGVALLCFLAWGTRAVFIAVRMITHQAGL